VRKQWRILALGALVSAAAIYAIVSQIDLALLFESLRTANYLPLVPAAALTVLGLFTRSVRWRVLLGGGLNPKRAFHILNIAYFVNGILPMRAGEVGRAWLASRGENSVPIMKSASTIVVERLLDLLAVAVFIALALTLAAGAVPDALRVTGFIAGGLALAGFLFLVMLASRRGLATRMFEAVISRVPVLKSSTFRPRLAEFFEHILDGVQPIAKPVSLALALFWTAVSWGFSFLTGLVLMLVFYPQGDAVVTLLFIASASFAVALPAVPGNVGPYEASILLAFSALGFTGTPEGLATATAFALVVHFINLAINAVLGVWGFIAEGVTLGQITGRAAPPA
jgi:uncharacterized protein (TIRG00374 family)